MTLNTRLDFGEETRLNLEAEEQAQLAERQASGSQASPAPHFICETFFLTARALHLGYVKVVADVHDASNVCPAVLARRLVVDGMSAPATTCLLLMWELCMPDAALLAMDCGQWMM